MTWTGGPTGLRPGLKPNSPRTSRVRGLGDRRSISGVEPCPALTQCAAEKYPSKIAETRRFRQQKCSGRPRCRRQDDYDHRGRRRAERWHDWAVGTMKASSATCPACGTTAPAKDVRAYAKKTGFGARLYAVMEVKDGHRSYRNPDPANCTPLTPRRQRWRRCLKQAMGLALCPTR